MASSESLSAGFDCFLMVLLGVALADVLWGFFEYGDKRTSKDVCGEAIPEDGVVEKVTERSRQTGYQ